MSTGFACDFPGAKVPPRMNSAPAPQSENPDPVMCSALGPQVPAPPQIASIPTPRLRAASKTELPAGTLPERPDGWKTTLYVSGLDLAVAASIGLDIFRRYNQILGVARLDYA